MENQAELSILRRRQVEERTGLSCSSIYERINPKHKNYDPTFPKPIDLGSGKRPPVGWISAEISSWIALQVQKSRSASGQRRGDLVAHGVA